MTTYEAPTTGDQRMWDLWLTHTYQATIVVSEEAGIFGALDEGAATARELADRLDFDERATTVVLRLLASLGLVVPREGRFQLTDTARLYLLRASPYYWGPMMRVNVNEWQHTTLTAALRKKGSAQAAGPQGTPPPSHTGRSVDGWVEGHIDRDRARGIAATMHSHSVVPAINAARTYDFSGVRCILVVCGCYGCFMIP